MSRNTHLSPLSSAWFWLCTLFAAWLIGCGGGGDQTAGVGVGGTGGSGGTGPITGLGSIFVNDVRFDDSVGALDEDGRGITSALGMVVDVSAGPTRTDSQGYTAATATSVRVIKSIEGPVQGVPDTASGTVVVLGQTVIVDGATLYQGLPSGLASLNDGMLVTVYGLYDASRQRYQATRIEATSELDDYVVRGRLAPASNSGGHPRFAMGNLEIDTQGYSPQPVAGQLIRMKLLKQADPDGRWTLHSFEVVTPTARADGTLLKIEGLVSDFISLGNFKVDGQSVNASTYDDRGNPLANGSRVAAEGSVSDGILVANKLNVKSGGGTTGAKAKLIGAISGVNTGLNQFHLKGLLVNYDPPPGAGTQFDDGAQEGDLSEGRQVEAEGTLSLDGTVLTATRIRLR
jgi:hypothetical protein